MNLPTISIITVSLNCEKVLKECYQSIMAQDYPKDNIEMLLLDGGSLDKSRQIAASFGAQVIDAGYRDNQEARRYIGFQRSNSQILAYIDSDNVLPDPGWLRQMVEPFMHDPDIIATQTLRYGYDKKRSVMNRYFALFGANDPVAFYLGKADRIPWYKNGWPRIKTIIRQDPHYYTVRFTADDLPTIGCNGFLVRRDVFSKLKIEPEDFFHTDVHKDLINMGMDKYAIVNNTVLHITGETFLSSIKKRLLYKSMHCNKLGAKRRFLVFDPANKKDILNLLKFMLFACTFIKPLYDSLRGYIKLRDKAWFLHPLVCFGFMAGYGYSTLTACLKRTNNGD